MRGGSVKLKFADLVMNLCRIVRALTMPAMAAGSCVTPPLHWHCDWQCGECADS